MSERGDQVNSKSVLKVKLVLVGDMEVGKTSLALKFAKGTFSETYQNTIGASFLVKMVETSNKIIIFHIWDTAGQERFHSLIPMYLRDAKAAIVLYDITSQDSFNGVKDVWMRKLRTDGPQTLVPVIVGNKLDLASERQVDFQSGEAFASKWHCMFAETSAKTGENVEKLFTDIASSLSEVETSTDETEQCSVVNLEDSTETETKKKRCC